MYGRFSLRRMPILAHLPVLFSNQTHGWLLGCIWQWCYCSLSVWRSRHLQFCSLHVSYLGGILYSVRPIFGFSIRNWNQSSMSVSVLKFKVTLPLKCSFGKGQLISECLFEKIVWTKIPTKNLIDSAQQRLLLQG